MRNSKYISTIAINLLQIYPLTLQAPGIFPYLMSGLNLFPIWQNCSQIMNQCLLLGTSNAEWNASRCTCLLFGFEMNTRSWTSIMIKSLSLQLIYHLFSSWKFKPLAFKNQNNNFMIQHVIFSLSVCMHI